MPANAPGIPDGDYASSCRGCQLEDASILSCSHCEKPCGARVASSLDTNTCSEAATVTNSAGKLACKEPPAANAEDVPQGTYLGSCHGCTVVGDVLSCTQCGDGAGAQHASSLALDSCDRTTVVNEQGALACTPPPRQLGDTAESVAPSPEPTETGAPAREASGSQANGHDEL